MDRAGNRAGHVRPTVGWAKTGPGRAKIGPDFLGQNFSSPALKTRLVGPNSLLKAKKIWPGLAISGRAKFGPVFFGPII